MTAHAIFSLYLNPSEVIDTLLMACLPERTYMQIKSGEFIEQHRIASQG